MRYNLTSAVPLRQSYRGDVNILLLPFIFLFVFFITAAGFGLWAFNGREDYRNNVDSKVAAAVKVAKQQEDVVKDKQAAEADKQPLKTYVGPEQYGSVHISYPKTWSGYINSTATGNQPLDAYFQPDVVPNLSDQASIFALRVEIVSQSYTSIVNQFSGQVTAKTVTASAYSFPKVPSVVGVRFDGQINGSNSNQATGSIVVMPIRDKTLEVFTQSSSYLDDFNNSVLPNITFSP